MPTMPWPTTATIGTPPTSRTIRCRYLRRGTAGQCTAEAVDENGEILLCTKHLSRALELVRHRLPQ